MNPIKRIMLLLTLSAVVPTKALDARVKREMQRQQKITAKEVAHWQLDQAESSLIRQELANDGDVQYTGKLTVGGQTMDAVLDTGSFDLLVFSQRCYLCGDQYRLFNESMSPELELTEFRMDHSFGSGSTKSLQAYDTVSLGTLTSKRQSFWDVYEAAMPILRDATFQAILGCGPPMSSVKMALEEEDELKEIIESKKRNGEPIPAEMNQELDHYIAASEVAKETPGLVSQLGIQYFSICLGQVPGSKGYFIWNDYDPQASMTNFVQVPVVGDLYWSAELTDVGFNLNSQQQEPMMLGCGAGRCSAVLDSGTSLIVVPPMAMAALQGALRTLSLTANCSDLSGLPDLEFRLDGKLFTLPPSSYMGEVSGSLPSELSHLMPHVPVQRPSLLQDQQQCVPLLMTLDADTQFGPLWVFGLPFFRRYYSTFELGPSSDDDSHFVAKSMSFALADEDCNLRMGAQLESHMSDRSKHQAIKVKGSKLRAPRWMYKRSKTGRKYIHV